jgi:hypothetical protein
VRSGTKWSGATDRGSAGRGDQTHFKMHTKGAQARCRDKNKGGRRKYYTSQPTQEIEPAE